VFDAAREKTWLWFLIFIGVVATLLGQTHAREICAPSAHESGIFAKQTQASSGENYDRIQYDALDSLLAANRGGLFSHVGTTIDIYHAGAWAVGGYVGLLNKVGNFYGNEAWRMTEDYQNAGIIGAFIGISERQTARMNSVYEVQEMILALEKRIQNDPEFRNAALSKLMNALARNLLNPDCLEKLMRKIRGEAGFALLTMGASEWAAGVRVGGETLKVGEVVNAAKTTAPVINTKQFLFADNGRNASSLRVSLMI
jgi:hypothetical protein